jgi:membrane associated rhomboid family serine protease
MTNFSTKIRLIFIPYLIIAASFLVIYSFLDWLLLIRFELPVNEEVVHFWLAFALPWVPVFIWLSPRIRLLVLKDKKGNLPFLYRFIAAIAIAVPVIIAQNYLVTATGSLTQLQNINEINGQKLTKYYELKEHFIDKWHVAVYRRTETSGRNNETLSLIIDVACPIVDKQEIPIDLRQSNNTQYVTAPKAWLCYEFSKNISNHLSDDEKNIEFKTFDTVINNEFKEKNFDDFIYLDRIGKNDRSNAYLKAINAKFNDLPKPIILEGVNKPFEARNGEKLKWIFLSMGIGAAVWLLMISIPKINKAELKKMEEYTFSSDWRTFYESFTKFKSFGNIQITVIIIALNAIVFLIMVFAGLGVVSFDSHDLLNWGANFRPKTIDGEWWRLLTSIFLHAGLMHLFANMVGLLLVAIFLEPLLGRLKYAVAYLICGLVASATSILWHPATISIGASGAIMGLYGVLLALLTTNKIHAKAKRSILIITLPLVAINLLLGFLGGVDNAAHIGGLLCGVLIGYVIYFFGNLPEPKTRTARVSSIKENHDI